MQFYNVSDDPIPLSDLLLPPSDGFIEFQIILSVDFFFQRDYLFLRISDFQNSNFLIFLEQKHADLGTRRYVDLDSTTRSTPASELLWDQF